MRRRLPLSLLTLALAAAGTLHAEVPAPQDTPYAPGTIRLVIEAGVADGWWRYAGEAGDVIAMRTFGQSAPAKQLFARFGFSAAAVVDAARRLLARNQL